MLALARGLSGVGTYAAAVALSYQVYDATRSAFWLSATLILTYGVTGLLAPFAGALVDRVDRRKLAVAADLCAAVVWGGAALLTDPAVVIGLAFLASVFELVSSLSSSAAVPNLVDEPDLPWAVSFVAATTTVAKLGGPALGGALYVAGGAELVFACNAV